MDIEKHPKVKQSKYYISKSLLMHISWLKTGNKTLDMVQACDKGSFSHWKRTNSKPLNNLRNYNKSRAHYLPVSPCITKIRDDCSNILSRCSPTGIDHDQKFHEILICWRARWLHKENITAPHTFLQLDIYFAICEPFYVNLPKF